MSATRSSTTGSSSTASRPRARSSCPSWTRCRTARRWSSPRTACPRRCRRRPQARGLNYLDATCPLVSKVHRQAERLIERGRHILFVGHAGHPEVIGTFGQVPDGHDEPGRDRARRRDDRAGRPGRARLPHPDHALGRRHRGDRRHPAPPLPGDPGAAQRGHLLRHLEPAGGGQGDRRRAATRCW